MNEDRKRELISEGLELADRANKLLESVFAKAEAIGGQQWIAR